jgi:hypothetical protein
MTPLAEARADLQACPGTCNAAWRNTDPRQRGDPIPGEPVWCPPCTARIRHQLTELDDLAALLNATADGHREQAHSPIQTARHAPSPSAAADTLDELTTTLQAWEDAYRELKGWPSPPRRGYLASITTAVTAWLTSHLTGILDTPFAAEFGHEIRQWHKHLTDQTKAGTGIHSKPVPCPRCGLRLLVYTDGTDYVHCAGCNRHLTLDEYHEELAAAAHDLCRLNTCTL